MKMQWVPSKVELLQTQLAAGANCHEIAAQIGCTPRAVVEKAQRLGIQRRRSPTGCDEREWTVADIERLVGMALAGQGNNAIALAMNCTPSAIAGKVFRLRQQGVLPGAVKKTPYTPEERRQRKNESARRRGRMLTPDQRERQRGYQRTYYAKRRRRPAVQLDAIQSVGVSLFDLTSKQCPYILPSGLYCGNPKFDNWCEEHSCHMHRRG